MSLRASPNQAKRERARAEAMSNVELFDETLQRFACAGSDQADRDDEISAEVFEAVLRQRLAKWLKK